MSSSRRRPAHPSSSFVCHNPLCTSRKNTFLSDKAFSIHLTHSPTCVPYVMSSGKKRAATPLANDAPVLASSSLTVTYESNKRPTLLQRDFVNDGMPNLMHFAPNDIDDTFDDVCADDVSNPLDPAPNKPNLGSPQSKPWLPSADGPFFYTTDQKWTVALLKLLDNMNAPDYAFHHILQWARGANADNYSFFPDGGLTRARNVQVMFSSLRNAKQLLPSVQTVMLPHGNPCDVIAYDFVPQLLSLLQNRKIMVQEQLGD